MNQDPVFVVGIPRSGTTLLTAMLAAHSRLSCGPETHFFRRLAETEVDLLDSPQTWPEPALNFISSIKHSGFTGYESKYLLEKYELDANKVADFLAAKEPAIPNILASVTEQYMIRQGKSRWIEKTPDHLAYVHSIRTHFPASPIVRIMRDPRDVALSLQKVPWGVNSFVEGLVFWRDLDETSAEFFSTDQNSYTIRFEDLISNPAEAMEQLCQFIGEEFEPVMLDTSTSGRRVNSRDVPWKKKASQPLDARRVAAWRNELATAENKLAEAMLGDRIMAYEYPLQEEFTRVGEIYPNARLAVKYAADLESLVSSGVRFWKTNEAEKSTVKVFLGDPTNDHWLQGKKSEDLAHVLSILADVIGTKFSKSLAYWIPERGEEDWTGIYAYFLKKILSPYRLYSNPVVTEAEPGSVLSE
jgi:hypothetical protein